MVVYFLVFGMGVYYMLKLMKQGPSERTEFFVRLKHPGLNNRALSEPFEAVQGE